MTTLTQGYRAASFLIELNLDRLIVPVGIGLGLLTGAYLGSL